MNRQRVTRPNVDDENGTLAGGTGAADRLLEVLLEHATHAIFLADDDMRYLRTNPAAARLTGYTTEELLQLRVMDLMPRGQLQQAQDAWRELRSSGHLEGELPLMRKDGSLVNTEYRAVADIRPGVHLSLVWDATVRNRALAELRNSAQRMRLLLQQVPAVLWTTDRDVVLTSIQGSILNLLGVEPEHSLLGRSVRDLVAEADAAVVPAHRAALRGEQVSYQVQHAGRILDSRVEPFRDEGEEIIGVVGAAFDITDQVAVERVLRESEERYRRLFDEGLTGNCVTNTHGHLLECNSAFACLFGFSSIDEALSAGVPELVPDRKTRRTILRRLMRDHRVEGMAIEGRKRSGETAYLIGNLAGDFDATGELVEIRVYLFDDTERRQTEQQLRQAQKMEAVGRLAGGVAHDFNNLITTISGYSDLCLMALPDDAPIRSYLEEIKNAGDRAASLARQLLAFSRLQVLRPEVLDLNEVILEIESMLARLIGEDIRVVTELAPALPPVKADPRQVEQVIVNLALNARDAMVRGGTLALATESRSVAPEDLDDYEFPLTPGQYVSLSVRDTGLGMNEEVRSRAFEPFFTTKEHGRGSGLGLSTVYGIVKQSGGFITIGSTLGKGTSVEVLLPRTDDLPREAPLPDPRPEASHGRETLLVVEDEDPLRQLLTEILLRHGYTVIEAADGQEALEVAEQFPGRIHLLITDVVMPDMRGPDLERAFRTERPETRVLFISGYPGDDAVDRGDLSRGHPFLQKPFDQATFVHQIRDILDSRE